MNLNFEEQFEMLKNEYYKQERRITPVHSNRASEIGHPCLRYLVYLRTRWEDQLPPPLDLVKIFKAGREQEVLAKRQLQEMGYLVKESIYQFYDPELNLSGAIDCFISHPTWQDERGHNVFYAAEIKSLDRFNYDELNTAEDFLKTGSYFIRRYYYQLQAYLYLVSKQKQDFEQFAFFILRNKVNSDLKMIKVNIDYGVIEDIFKRAELINKSVEKGELPERVDEFKICQKCSFRHICLPPVDGGQGLDVELNEEVQRLIERLVEIEPEVGQASELIKEYEKLRERVKYYLQPRWEAGSEEILIGDYVIRAKKVETTRVDTKNLPQEIKEQFTIKTHYYKWEIAKIKGD